MVKRDDITGEWRRLRNKELYDLYSSPTMIKSRRIKWAGHMGHMRDRRDVYKVFVRRPDGKRPLGRTRCRWDSIKTDRQEVGWRGMDWIYLASNSDRWQALVNAVMNLWVP
jgi:hypothetical protein